MMKNNNALFYTCSLIEHISRKTHNHPKKVIEYLGEDLERIYNYEDVFHMTPIEEVVDTFIQRRNIKKGNFDYISKCEYNIPSYWDVGKIFERLIEDCYEETNVLKGIHEVYNSWLADKIYNFNSDLYYQPRDYLRECYKEGIIISD